MCHHHHLANTATARTERQAQQGVLLLLSVWGTIRNAGVLFHRQHSKQGHLQKGRTWQWRLKGQLQCGCAVGCLLWDQKAWQHDLLGSMLIGMQNRCWNAPPAPLAQNKDCILPGTGHKCRSPSPPRFCPRRISSPNNTHLVPLVYQALRELIDVILHAAKVGVEKVADHQHTMANAALGPAPCCCWCCMMAT